MYFNIRRFIFKNFPDPVADLQKDLRKKLSGGKANFSA